MGRDKIVGAHRLVGLPVFSRPGLDIGVPELYYCIVHGRRVFVPPPQVGFGMKPSKKGNEGKPPKQKRARSAYIFFNMERHKAFEGQGLKFKEASKRIADEWKQLSEEQKEQYQAMSRAEKANIAEEAEAQEAEAKANGIELPVEEKTPKAKVKSHRAPSGYNLFIKQKCKDGASLTDASQAWKYLSDEEKKEFLNAAKESKRVFQEAEAQKEANESEMSPKKAKKSASTMKKKKSSAKKPPRGPSGYTLYMQKEMGKDKSLKIPDIATMWQSLSDSKKEKFKAKAAEVKRQLAEEFAAKVASGEISPDESDDKPTASVAQPKSRKGRVATPNAYNLFAKTRRADLKSEGLEFGEISKRVGLEWRGMGESARAPFVEEANRLKAVAQESATSAEMETPKKGSKRPLEEADDEGSSKKQKKSKKHKKKKKGM